MNKAGRELFSTQKGTDGLPIVLRPVIDRLKSLLSNWVGLGNSYFKSAAQCVLSSTYILTSEKLQHDDILTAVNGYFHYQLI